MFDLSLIGDNRALKKKGLGACRRATIHTLATILRNMCYSVIINEAYLPKKLKLLSLKYK